MDVLLLSSSRFDSTTHACMHARTQPSSNHFYCFVVLTVSDLRPEMMSSSSSWLLNCSSVHVGALSNGV